DFDFTPNGTFAVDLPNGSYTVTVTMGSGGFAKNAMGVFLQGTQVDSVSTSGPGVFAVKTYTVTISTGQLDLGLRNLGGDDAVINGLEVARSGGGNGTPNDVGDQLADLVALLDGAPGVVGGSAAGSG